jgi:CNT family concentrative nucleoside transporter
MAAPAGLMLAKIIYPEDGVPRTQGGAVQDPERTTANVIDAAASGAGDGMKLAINVAAMLIAFIALVAVVNAVLGMAGLSLATIFGYAFYPLSWAMGVDTKDPARFREPDRNEALAERRGVHREPARPEPHGVPHG